MKKLRIVVTGLIGSIPIAGLTLHYLQYVLGLRELGHDVLYLEDTGTWCYDPASDSMVEDSANGLKYLADVMRDHNHASGWTFIDHRNEQFGITGSRLDQYLKTADVFINVTGAGIIRENYLHIPERIYVDTDPGYIQMRIDQGSKKDMEHLQRHTTHFSFGCNIGKPECSIPNTGIHWLPTRQPIVLRLWPVTPHASANALFTTILKWQTYEPVEYKGEIYGLKNIEFLRFMGLPVLAGPMLEIAMAGAPPTKNLLAAGWQCKDARTISATIDQYRNYIQSSKGEWSIAKNGYVKTRSGWFSDRSAAYLASGRPVILQSTGYEEWLETGHGLLSFTTLEEAAAAIESVNVDYKAHCLAARELAEEYFRSDKVLTAMLSSAGE